MVSERKPKLGVLGLILGAYEPIFPGITERQEKYLRETLESVSDKADFVFDRAARGRLEIEEQFRRFNSSDLDGVVIFLLSYSEGQYLVHAAQNCNLPLALALVQPDETVGEDFEEIDLTVNQGIHGSQDNANCLMRAGIKCSYFAGSRTDGSFAEFIDDFGHAAQTAQKLKKMRIGVIGKLPGMGDVITDDMAFYRVIGPEFTYDSIGTVQGFCEAVTKQEIDREIERDRERFEIDEKLSYESHFEAARMYLGIKKYLKVNRYDGYTLHFDELGADGRFCQLPFLAASNLMAEGYGYAAEGDAVTAALMSAAFTLCQNANFSEMYMMDLKRDAILFCHAGEGNWATAREDKKPRLIDRYFGEGGLENPPTPIFTPKTGKATAAALVHVNGDKFKLVCSHGEILDKDDLKKCDMPYFFFRPQSGTAQCVTGWLAAGGGHHEVIMLGDYSKRLKLLCDILAVEYVEV